MSLVAYGSSDESSDEEISENCTKHARTALNLPPLKNALNNSATNSQPTTENNEIRLDEMKKPTASTDESTLFKNLPKPKQIEIVTADEEEDDLTLPQKEVKVSREKPQRKDRVPVKISLPALSQFKDVKEEEETRKRNKIKPSEKGTGLFSILPPPKGSATKAIIKNLIPDTVRMVPRPTQPSKVKGVVRKALDTTTKKTILTSTSYDSDSDDENSSVGDGKRKADQNVDFFSLASSGEVPATTEIPQKDFFSLSGEPHTISAISPMCNNISDTYPDKISKDVSKYLPITESVGSSPHLPLGFVNQEDLEISKKNVVSNPIHFSREEIIMKNKEEIGPKLLLPEQDYNVDPQGNVAFDEKAIEYLCGKRGVKRKNKDFTEANIIEINGEDIKPDEREWLVKALTEEPAQRPVSMEGAGPSTQSRKKHQITYLAHQAKAMEVELKNQWAQNRVTRKQTQSKYGF